MCPTHYTITPKDIYRYAGGMLLITNNTGHPSLTLRTGFRTNNRPHGITLWGNLFDEGTIRCCRPTHVGDVVGRHGPRQLVEEAHGQKRERRARPGAHGDLLTIFRTAVSEPTRSRTKYTPAGTGRPPSSRPFHAHVDEPAAIRPSAELSRASSLMMPPISASGSISRASSRVSSTSGSSALTGDSPRLSIGIFQ